MSARSAYDSKTPHVSPNSIKSINNNNSINSSSSDGSVWDEGEVGAAGFIINYREAHADALKRSPKITLGSEVCLFVNSLQTTS